MQRRAFIARAAAGALAGAAGLGIGPGAPSGRALADERPALPAAGAAFDADTVPALARALARLPYAAPADDLPGSLKGLSREQYGAIRIPAERALWADEALGFTVEPLHRGSIFTTPVALALVEAGTVRPVAYDRAQFETGGFVLPDLGAGPGASQGSFQGPPGPSGFSGFRLRARFGTGDLSDFGIFQGASFFRLLARGQGFGVTARALTLRPADARGEEFPLFRAFWIERPAPGEPLVIHALVDSESAAGALRMVLRPGDASVAEIETTIVSRRAIDHLGLGGMQAAYLFGPHDRRGSDDARAGAYAAGGLQIRNGADEAIWRPVHNPESLQISSFVDRGPKGFGLMQRARAYAAFEDDVQHWEWRPSLWLEPLDDWNAGAVTLLEIPSDSEFNENVLAYWRPETPIAAATETRFRYRQTWCWEPPAPPPVAGVAGTRSGRGGTAARRLFLVDFAGEALFEAGADALEAALTAGPGSIVRRQLYAYPERRTVRVAFELDPGGERVCELRLALTRAGRPVTETWLYRWTP
ncbi:glucan biosynthesis protein [Methylobacterium sp. A54F]